MDEAKTHNRVLVPENYSIQFFIYLRAELNSGWPITTTTTTIIIIIKFLCEKYMHHHHSYTL
jgi:hypothetical protein